MPFAAPEYGLFASRIVPDAGLILFSLAMAWSLVRLTESGDGRWWLVAGFFGGLSLLSKYTAVFLAPGVLAFLLVPSWRMRWLRSPYPWGLVVIALAVFSPVLIWNWQHDWASFKFQFIRAGADHGISARTVGDFLRLQFALVGPILFPVALAGAVMLALRGYRQLNAAFILISTCALVPFAYFLWKSLSLRIGDTWPLLIWPFAFAAAAINLAEVQQQQGWIFRTAESWAKAAIVLGIVLNIAIFYYYSVGNFALAARQDQSRRKRAMARLPRVQKLSPKTSARHGSQRWIIGFMRNCAGI
jgi:4-amino-4-deoxy-L-arabinose transferase-like glycosyltransferase